MSWTPDLGYAVQPTRLAALATTAREKAAIDRLKRDCDQCEIGQVPRERLVFFRVHRHGELRAGWCCPCRRDRVTL